MNAAAPTSDDLTHERFVADVARALGLPAEQLASVGDDPFEAGLDSLRTLTLLEGWRKRGAIVTFVELAERPSLQAWWRLLSERRDATRAPTQAAS
jgi:aryl carrier-like protein